MRDLDYVRLQPVGVKHIGDGLAIPAVSNQSRRVRRYLLLSGAQKLCFPYWTENVDAKTGEILAPDGKIKRSSEFRLSVCCRSAVGDEGVKVYRHGEGVGYSGVMRCGNVWGCVVCCAKIMRKRSDQISSLFDYVHAAGGSAVMVTYTASHSAALKLGDTLSQFKAAQAWMVRNRRYRDIVSVRSGSVVVTEITWNQRNGWHPHQHQAWFYPFKPGPDPKQLASELFKLWQIACNKFGLETREKYREKRIGVDVTEAWDASEYLCKFDREREWSLAAEVTAGRLKTGQGQSLTPWGLLEDAILREPGSTAHELFIEYLRATKGKSCVSLKGATDLLRGFGLPTSLDDWADANEVGEGEIVGTLSAQAFDKVVRVGGLGRLLESARAGGLAGLDKELQSF